jgi:hypothetical protein
MKRNAKKMNTSWLRNVTPRQTLVGLGAGLAVGVLIANPGAGLAAGIATALAFRR